jgi:cytochrome c-type biogenesis protein CcmH
VRRVALGLALAMLALALAPALAGACPRASLPDIEDEVMCPVCGTTLIVSESPQAARERAYIRGRIAACATKKQIKAALVSQYGPGVLASPRGKGFDLAAWLVPIVVVVAALGALGFFVPRWRRRRGPPGADPKAPLSPADKRRLDEDLARYDL